MDGETNCIIQTVGGYEVFEHMVERGRQLHNQAIFELFARLVSSAVLFVKKCGGMAIGTRGSMDHGAGLSIHQSSQNPVQAAAEI